MSEAGSGAGHSSDEGGSAAHSSDERGSAAHSRLYPFAHASEAELARILDFYAVRWEYEPHTFPILWNLDGDVLESFSPDFYLPDFDLYVELTTLKQRLVHKKNRKLRRLRELYPDVRVKLFYARDFRALMMKYGKLAFADGLSGTLGQVSPPGRPAEPDSPVTSTAGGRVETPAVLGSRDPAQRDTSGDDDLSIRAIVDADRSDAPNAGATLSKRAHRRRRAARHAALRATETVDNSATSAT